MLQTNDRQNADSHNYAPAESSLPELIDFFWGILRQQLVLILSVTLLAIAACALYIYITPPAYTARATLIIDRGKLQAQLGEMARELPVGVVEMESQAMLIKSESVVLAVIKNSTWTRTLNSSACRRGKGDGSTNCLPARRPATNHRPRILSALL